MKGAAALALAPFGSALAASDPKTMRPQPGDRFSYMSGEKKGQPVMAADFEIGQPPKLVYPLDTASGTVRSARINQVMMIRVDPSQLSDDAKSRSAEGIVAYSAICTHNGCPITLLHEDKRSTVCTCHGSRFDLADGGNVLDGPAGRRVANLPVGLTDGFVTVTGAFSGTLGPATQ